MVEPLCTSATAASAVGYTLDAPRLGPGAEKTTLVEEKQRDGRWDSVTRYVSDAIGAAEGIRKVIEKCFILNPDSTVCNRPFQDLAR
jgi:hypothetical protein